MECVALDVERLHLGIAEIAPTHIQSTKCIAIFTSNSHNDLRRIELVYFEKPPGFPSVR